MEDFKMIATTQMGLEEILSTELQALGGKEVTTLNRAVSFVGDLGFMYKANLCLRTAIRILKPIETIEVNSDVELYKKAKRIEWDRFISLNDTIAVSAAVNSSFFNHSHYVALKVKDAIVDYFRDNYKGKRPDVNVKRPDIRVNIHITNDKCTISLDSSGDSLHKRGYRTITNEAPISEVLAAGLVLLSNWNQKIDFLDPMCGSGTIVIEAAMIACNIPPSLNRQIFCFMNWKDFDQNLWDIIKQSAIKKITSFSGEIIGCDRAFSAIRKTEANVQSANLKDVIKIQRSNFIKNPYLFKNQGIVLFNPPYGERLNVDVNDLYKKIGEVFKKKYAGCSVWLITSDLEAVKHIGLKHTRRIKLFNGKLECYFLKYEMYEGSKKQKNK